MQPKGFEPLTSVESGQRSTTELRLQPIFSNDRTDRNTNLDGDVADSNNHANDNHTLANSDRNCRNNSFYGMDYMDTF